MIAQIGGLLIDTAGGLLVLALLLRFYMQAVRAPFRNALGELVLGLSDWLVLPVRRWVPGLFGLDLSSLLLAWLTELLMVLLIGLLHGASLSMDHLGVAAIMALFQLGRHLIWLLIAVLVLQAVTGWTNPGSMAFRLFSLMCEALCRPFRRFIKPIGQFDFAPLAALVSLQIGLIVLDWLQRTLQSAF
jgi:YggT family protein